MQQKKNTILTTSTANGRTAHTIPTLMKRITVLFALIVSLALGARAEDYVFTYTNGNNTYFLGQSTTPTTSFVPNASIYTGNSGSTFRNANGYYIRYNNGLAFSTTTGTNFTINNNNQLAYDVYNGYYFYYLNFNNSNSTWRISNDNRRATASIVETETIITEFKISGDESINTTGTNNSYTHTNATYYYAYTVNDNNDNNDKTYYNTNPDDPASVTKPATGLSLPIGSYTWSISDNSYATVNASTGAITVNSLPTTDTRITLTCSVTHNGKTQTVNKDITIIAPKIDPEGITAEDLILPEGETGTIVYELQPSGEYRNVEFSVADVTIATVNANGVVTGKKAGTTTITLTAKKLNGQTSPALTTTINVKVVGRCATPVITIDKSTGNTTITCSTEDATIYYTTDGSDPTTSSTVYNGPFTVTKGTVVKAMATKSGFINSAIASQKNELAGPTGVSGGVVTLNDLEDHTWTYYQQSENLPSGYPTTYLSSPNPRNVKITYRGGGVSGASAVAISALEGEGQNEMVYYKTLEKSVPGMSGDYPYTVISNPFSKRPKLNSTYYGFNGWKVISGGEYILEYDNDGKIGLDETIHFTNLDNNYTPNCMSAEIVFEATWTQATVKTGNSAPSFDGGTYETNFWVLSGNPNNAITVPTNCTMTARYPDGSVSWDGNFTRAITAGGNNAKVEFVNMNSTENVSAANYTFTMGRGIVNSGNGGQLQGCTRNDDCEQTVKVESGTYSSLHHFTYTLSSSRKCNQFVILGCDYDRAKSDNNKLKITGAMYLANAKTINRASGVLFARSNIKSGTFQKTITGTYSGTAAQSYYFGCYGSSNRSAGHRYMLVEGGDIRGLCGGTDHTTNQQAGDPAFTLRIRGSENNPIINGIIYGAAENADCRGRRTMVLTGGTVKGWIAGGANGTESSGGTMTGATFVYVGGKANINSSGSQTVINRAVGGNVFAAGCGNGTNSSSGQVTQGTNVVVADDAYVERGVYGGGSYGYTTNTSNIYITGGRIGGVAGGVNGTSYSANIPGGVYGGACQNRGGTVNIYMTGGEVNGGLYGGSNNSGTISNNVTMKINGGQVGTPSAPANIHGGGYGKDTKVDGNVTLTLGSNTTDPGVTVYGDVYGGSALGTVNDANSDKTEVTLNCGTINGSLYGGGLGNATEEANVNGAVTVTVNGGSVKKTSVEGSGGVYGANNINGEPKSSVTVVINGTAPAPSNEEYALYAVYGGGNQADYDYNGGPIVTVNNCENSIEYVYGGGNAAAVKTTNVTIWGGNVIGNVFGGGHGYKDGAGADVEGDVNVAIKGGTIKKVFGGSNSKGNIGGTIELTIDKDGDCPMRIGEVYGGGNEANGNAGTLTIGCTGALVEGDEGHLAHPENIGKTLEGIGAVYGGANNANIGNDVTLNINSGMVAKVFGGNNTGGTVNGNVTVNVNENANACGWYVGKVHGGGYGNGTNVAGNVTVNIENGTIYGDVYGGSALGKVNTNTSNTTAVNLTGGVIHGDAYGGGLGDSETAADVNGNVTVTLNGTAFELTTTTDDKGNIIPTSGRVFGCNNINGSPKGTVLVKVLNTVAKNSDGTIKDKPKTKGVYELQAVYGGGNLAAYNPTDPLANGQFTSYTYGGNPVAHDNKNKPVQVVIDGCGLSSIEYVYGGGNAAATPATDVTILGSYEIGSVFGGGNGKDKYTLDGGTTWKENLGADVGIIDAAAYATDKSGKYGTGNAMTSVLGGTVHNIYGGSNMKGNIVGNAVAYLDAASDCPLDAGDIYGGGNEAYMDGGSSIQLGCITYLKEIYGGARNADVGGDINLTITSGHFDRIFGGNNLGGAIKGSITVNIEETGCKPITIGELYGCGNKAAYSVYGYNVDGTLKESGEKLYSDPVVNIRSFTSIGNVYGGGLGEEAVVAGNPTVNINVVKGVNNLVEGWSYNGKIIDFGDDYKVTLPVHETGKIGAIGTVFGGGNAAEVIGNTNVNIGTETSVVFESLTGTEAQRTKTVEGADIRGNVYGGGNQANVTGKTNVKVGKGN